MLIFKSLLLVSVLSLISCGSADEYEKWENIKKQKEIDYEDQKDKTPKNSKTGTDYSNTIEIEQSEYCSQITIILTSRIQTLIEAKNNAPKGSRLATRYEVQRAYDNGEFDWAIGHNIHGWTGTYDSSGRHYITNLNTGNSRVEYSSRLLAQAFYAYSVLVRCEDY